MAGTMVHGHLLHLARPVATKFIIVSLLSSVYDGVGFEKFRLKRLEFLKSQEIMSSLELESCHIERNERIDSLILAR